MRTIAISGAASGIGRATAIRFAHAGWRVLALDRKEQPLAVLAAEHPGIEPHVVDVTDIDSWRSALTAALGERGELHALINNAGILVPGRFSEVPIERHRATIDVNVMGVVHGAHAAHPHLARTPKSVLVNLCSAAAIYGQAELSTYSASKFAVRALSEALDVEWAADGIDVVAIWPLYVRTPLIDGVDIASTRSMGVHLTADDVVEEIWRAVTPRSCTGG